MITIHQRHRQTDRRTEGQTDGRHAIPRPRICTKVHCAVKTNKLWRAAARLVNKKALYIGLRVYGQDLVLSFHSFTCLRYTEHWRPIQSGTPSMQNVFPVLILVAPVRSTRWRSAIFTNRSVAIRNIRAAVSVSGFRFSNPNPNPRIFAMAARLRGIVRAGLQLAADREFGIRRQRGGRRRSEHAHAAVLECVVSK